MPYNYVLDFRAREGNGYLLKNSILLFDEAHNIESAAEEGASISLSSQDLNTFIIAY